MPLTVPDSIKEGIGPNCIITRQLQTIELLQSLGMEIPDGNFKDRDYYDTIVEKGVELYPHMLDKFFIPARIREKGGFTTFLYELDKIGLW